MNQVAQSFSTGLKMDLKKPLIMSSNKPFRFLENMNIGNMLTSDHLNQVNGTCVQKTYKKGEFIYLAKNNAEYLYYIKSGRVKIGSHSSSGKEIIKTILREGEIFGELVLIGQQKRRDFAQAMESTQVYQIKPQYIMELIKKHDDISLFFINLLGTRILNLEQRLESMVFKDSNSRIIDFLIDMVEKRGERVGYEFVVRKFITHQEIANLTATSRQTVTTVLNDLRSENIITFDRRRLLVRDIALLKAKV